MQTPDRISNRYIDTITVGTTFNSVAYLPMFETQYVYGCICYHVISETLPVGVAAGQGTEQNRLRARGNSPVNTVIDCVKSCTQMNLYKNGTYTSVIGYYLVICYLKNGSFCAVMLMEIRLKAFRNPVSFPFWR